MPKPRKSNHIANGDHRPGGLFIDIALFALPGAIQHELMLFAAIGIAIGGIDDLLIDIIYGARRLWRGATVYRRHAPMTTATLPAPQDPAPLAIFLPAWREAEVIGRMLRAALLRWGEGDYRIIVGIYPNDRATMEVLLPIAQGDPRILIAINPLPGPTTKADNLNSIWRAMQRDEAARGVTYKAIILHDAEDVVHRDELKLMAVLIERFALVQLPVLPFRSQQSQWIAGHYCDDFAEAHGKAMVVREALGAAVPSAGVGCAFRRDMLMTLVDPAQGGPFDPGSLTEDYEIGLCIAQSGGRGVFVQMRDKHGAPVCTREHFPETLNAAVKQKARWMTGIALAGWDRLGWRGGIAERWMRLRDRRSALAAIVLVAAYASVLLYLILLPFSGFSSIAMQPTGPFLNWLIAINIGMVAWRGLVRGLFVTQSYGWRQGLLSLPRSTVANFISILAAHRAMNAYLRGLCGATLLWEKTTHRFPDDAEHISP